MKKIIMEQLKQSALKGEYELSDDQFEQLIEEKILRAQQYYNALKLREDLAINELD